MFLTRRCGLPDPDDPSHGTAKGYQYHGCRCDRCREASRLFGVEQRKRHPEYYLEYERTRAKTPERQAYRKKYSKEHAEEISEKSDEFRKDNLELYDTYESIRRSKLDENMSKKGRAISAAYRKLIKEDPCFYCGGVSVEVDHYFPVSKGGSNMWFNLRPSCRSDNLEKRAHCGTWFILKKGFLW